MRKLVAMCSLLMLVGVGGMQLGLAAEPSRTFHSVTLQGEQYPQPGSVCTYWADVSGGSGSYTYEWSLGSTGNIIGTGSSVNVYITPGSHYAIFVRVWDGEEEASDGWMIIPTSGGSTCDS
jgi:hypothetical protein